MPALSEIPDGLIKGPLGRAENLPIPDIPSAEETVCHWLITAPSYHPWWSQYVLAVVRLRDLPGWPPPYKQFDGATHELLEMALDPSHGRYTARKMAKYERTGTLPILSPVNQHIQFEATDEEMAGLAKLACWGVVNGYMNAETADAPERIRDEWKTSLVKSLAHIRGEAHAS